MEKTLSEKRFKELMPGILREFHQKVAKPDFEQMLDKKLTYFFDEVTTPVLEDIYDKMATKQDLAELRLVTKKEIGALNTGMKREFEKVNTKLGTKSKAVKEIKTNHERRITRIESKLKIDPVVRLA